MPDSTPTIPVGRSSRCPKGPSTPSEGVEVGVVLGGLKTPSQEVRTGNFRDVRQM